MIERIWHGWTTPGDADEYERLLKEVIFPKIADKDVEGNHGIRLLRRSRDEEVEFMTVMQFASMHAVKQFAGDDYLSAYVPPEALEVLARFDDRAQPYEVRERIDY